ncbi:MAG: type II toxin-antitoxin system death-on-curing family toxin [Nitrososphaerales archaeon]
MAKRIVHHMDLPALVAVNREVVLLTREPSEYSKADGEQLESLLKDVASRADNQDFDQAIPEKASLLIFKLASGQHFRAGNKRTALVAGLVFLRKNGYKVKIDDPELISVVDKAGMAAANLDDVYEVVGRLSVKSAAERKAWESAVKQTVESNKKFLTDIGS